MNRSERRRRSRPIKHVHRDRNPNNKANWCLACSACGARYLDDERIDLAAGHWKVEHAAELGDTPQFNIVWIGVGPKPTKRNGRGRR